MQIKQSPYKPINFKIRGDIFSNYYQFKLLFMSLKINIPSQEHVQKKLEYLQKRPRLIFHTTSMLY